MDHSDSLIRILSISLYTPRRMFNFSCILGLAMSSSAIVISLVSYLILI